MSRCGKTHWETEQRAHAALARILDDLTVAGPYVPSGVCRCHCGKGYALTSKTNKPRRGYRRRQTKGGAR